MPLNIACYLHTAWLNESIRNFLAVSGFHCEKVASNIALSRALLNKQFDLLLIEDGGAPSEREKLISWIECRYGESTPFIVLSEQRNGEFAAQVLDAGAEDHVYLPLEGIELVARLNAICRRLKLKSQSRKICLGEFIVDADSRIFCYQGQEIELTPREFTMAWMFFSKPGVYISRETIGNAIWGVDSDIAGRTIEQHVYKLRKKLQLNAERGVLIRTAYSQGYRLELCSS